MARRIYKKNETPQNLKLAAVAELAMRDDMFTRTPGLCQRFVRQCVQRAHGAKYDAYHKGTAHQSMEAWRKSPYAVAPARGSVIGDILYKKGTKGQPEGHVGIRVAGNRVAENATGVGGRISGAKGHRSIEDFGRVELIVRLPDGK